jgi:anti-sigma-K factor RskA
MGLSVSLSAVGSSYKWDGPVARPGTLPAASWLAGRLLSRRWRWWAGVAAAAAVALVVGIIELARRGDTPLFQASATASLWLRPPASPSTASAAGRDASPG